MGACLTKPDVKGEDVLALPPAAAEAAPSEVRAMYDGALHTLRCSALAPL